MSIRAESLLTARAFLRAGLATHVAGADQSAAR